MSPTTPPESALSGAPKTSTADQRAASKTWREKLGFAVQFLAALAVTGAVLIYLLIFAGHDPQHGPAGEQPPESRLALAIEPLDAGRFRINPDSSLAARLLSRPIAKQTVSTPILQVTGIVAASLRPVGPDNADQWQFNDPEALETFYAWRSASIDVEFAEEQAARVRQLSETRIASRQAIVDRLRRLVRAGTDTMADLQMAEAELMEVEIEGKREVHEADSELGRARQAVAVAIRQLQLMGLDIEMLMQASSEVDIVTAEVPEEFQARVRIGQQCEARFIGFPRRVFPGSVQRIAPTLSLDRRALRVLFFVDDPDDQLRPGMFAKIGLGTESRESLSVPGTSIIHIGRDDFVFVREQPGGDTWRLARVEVGDTWNGTVEIFSGLDPGAEIIVEGAILLKPVAAASLREMRGAH